MSLTASPEPVFTVAAVASKLGVAPATLRTWDRRYGLGPSDHVEGSHRRYSNADIARLLVMRRLTLSGVAPSDAARIAVSTDGELPEVDGAAHFGVGVEPGRAAVSTRKLTLEDEIAIVREDRAVFAAAQGIVLPPPPAIAIEPTADALVAASLAFDGLSCLAILRATLKKMGPAEGWAHVISPAIGAIRSGNSLGTPGEDAAVMAAAACQAVLRETVPPNDSIDLDAAPILLSGAAKGADQLGAHFFALALQLGALEQPRSGGLAPRVLVHTHDFAIGSLDFLMDRADARAIVLFAATPPMDDGIVKRFIESGNQVKLFLVGAGWSLEDAGDNRRVTRTYAGAVYEVLGEMYSGA